jgi:hypothetical protein
VPGQLYEASVAEEIWAAEQFERLPPDEQDATFTQSIARYLDEVPEAFLNRVRGRLLDRIWSDESPRQ